MWGPDEAHCYTVWFHCRLCWGESEITRLRAAANTSFNRLNVSLSVCLHAVVFPACTLHLFTHAWCKQISFFRPGIFNLTIELSTQIHWIYPALPQGREPIENIWGKKPLLKREVREDTSAKCRPNSHFFPCQFSQWRQSLSLVRMSDAWCITVFFKKPPLPSLCDDGSQLWTNNSRIRASRTSDTS